MHEKQTESEKAAIEHLLAYLLHPSYRNMVIYEYIISCIKSEIYYRACSESISFQYGNKWTQKWAINPQLYYIHHFLTELNIKKKKKKKNITLSVTMVLHCAGTHHP